MAGPEIKKREEEGESLNTKEKKKRRGRASLEGKQREREGKSSPVYPTLSKRVHQTYGFSRNS
jgi:hypothetical protein